MDTNYEATATHGDRCIGETHRFRIGINSRFASEFAADRDTFIAALTDAVLDHISAKRPGTLRCGLYLQVWTPIRWCNVQEPTSGAIVRLGLGWRQDCGDWFAWGCNAVQMVRDIDVVCRALADDAQDMMG
jgi:hypothetical protein